MDEQDDIEDDPALASLLRRGAVPVFSNVTAQPHSFAGGPDLVSRVQVRVSPARTRKKILSPHFM